MGFSWPLDAYCHSRTKGWVFHRKTAFPRELHWTDSEELNAENINIHCAELTSSYSLAFRCHHGLIQPMNSSSITLGWEIRHVYLFSHMSSYSFRRLGVSHKPSLIFYSDGSMKHACNFYTTAYVLWGTETPAFYLGISKASLNIFLSLTPTNLAVKEEVSLSIETL